MIISASRRTDIPAFFSEWFFNRIKEGYLLVPNPFNAKMVSRISLHPELIDCIVFWTKNPAPMLGRLHELCHYKYYFQYTLNPYGHDIENNLPPLEQRIETFKQLSEKIGKEKIIWRYDPILTNEKYDTAFHRKAFAEIAARLNGYTETCMLGFIDHYPHIRTAARQFHIDPLTRQEIGEMAASFLETTTGTSIRLNTCTVKIDLSGLCIPPGHVHRPQTHRTAHRLPDLRTQRQKPARCLPLRRKHRHRHIRHLSQRLHLLLRHQNQKQPPHQPARPRQKLPQTRRAHHPRRHHQKPGNAQPPHRPTIPVLTLSTPLRDFSPDPDTSLLPGNPHKRPAPSHPGFPILTNVKLHNRDNLFNNQ